jgi:hypothetical protein
VAANGCSGGLDSLAKWINEYIRRAGDNRPLAFTGCCDEHDLLYEQGARWLGWRRFLPWLWGRVRDIPWRWKADRLLRQCIAVNLQERGRPWWVRTHVPWCVWLGARLFGWLFWGRG